MVYDPKAGIWLSRDPSGLAGGLNPYEAFNDDPVDFSDPTGLAPDPDWDLNVPDDPQSINNLSDVTRFKNEAWNRSSFYWDNDAPAPPAPIPDMNGGWLVFQKEDYSAENKYWYHVWGQWAKREKTLLGPNNQLQKWLNDHPKAKYGEYRTDSPGMMAPGATPPGVKITPIAISRPWGVAVHDVLSAGIIGKGGPGSKSLNDVGPSSGYQPIERSRPGTSREKLDPDQAKNTAADARANAAEAGAEVAASSLNEALNGMKQATVVVWTLDGSSTISGFYIEGQPAEIGDSIIRSWVSPNGHLWDRGKTYGR